MAQRRSRNRRLSRKSNNFSDILDDNTNIVDNADEVWFNKTSIRPSTSFALSKRASSVLNNDSTADATNSSENWYINLNRSENSKVIEENIKKNATQQRNEKNLNKSDKNLKLLSTDSDSEIESQKKRARFRSNKKSNIVDQSDVFSKALEKTTDSKTKTIIDVQLQVDNDSESINDDSRTMKRLRPKVFKTQKSRIESDDFDDICDSDNPSDKNESNLKNSESSSNKRNYTDSTLQNHKRARSEQDVEDKSINKSKNTSSVESPKKNASRRLTQTEAYTSKTHFNNTSKTIHKQPERELNASNSITEEVSRKRGVLFSQGEKNKNNSNTFDAYFDDSENDEHGSVENSVRQKDKRTRNESENSSIPTNIRRSVFQLKRTIQNSDSEEDNDPIENKSEQKNRKSNTSVNHSTKLKSTSNNKSINVSGTIDTISNTRNESSRNQRTSTSISTPMKDLSAFQDLANTSKSLFLRERIALAKEASDRETYGSSNESRKENYHKSMKDLSAKAYPNIMDRTNTSMLNDNDSDQTPMSSRRTHSRVHKSVSTRNDGEESGIISNNNKTISTPNKSTTSDIRKSRSRESKLLKAKNNVSNELLNKSNGLHIEMNKSSVSISKSLNPHRLHSQSNTDFRTNKTTVMNVTSEARNNAANKLLNKSKSSHIEMNTSSLNLSKNNYHHDHASSRSNPALETYRTTDMPNASRGSKVSKVGSTRMNNTLDRTKSSYTEISRKYDHPNDTSELYKSKTVNNSEEPQTESMSNVSSVVSDKSSTPERSNTFRNESKQMTVAESTHTSNKESFVEKSEAQMPTESTNKTRLSNTSKSKVEGTESESSVVTSSDGSYVEQNQSKMTNKTSIVASLSDSLKTPNPAQSTLNPSGKPLTRITQFSFRNSTITAQTDLIRSGSPRVGDPAPHADNVPETELQKSEEDVVLNVDQTDSDAQTNLPLLLSRQPIDPPSETELHNTLQDQYLVQRKPKESTVQVFNESQRKYSAEDRARVKKELDEEIERMKELDKRKAIIKRELEEKEQKSKAIFERIKKKHENEINKKNRKPIDKAYYWKGAPYKQPRLTFPQKWVTKRLYNHLWKCMEPEYGSRTRVKSEQLVQNISNLYSAVIKRKEYKNYKSELAQMIMLLAEHKIIINMYDFYRFCHNYLPFSFRKKAVPMQIPGVGRNVPYNPDTVNIPILEDQPD